MKKFILLLILLLITSTSFSATIKMRRDTATEWGNEDPILAAGEIGYDSTNNKIKIGTGSTAWSSLSYLEASTLDDTTIKLAVLAFAGGGSDIADDTVVDSYVPTAATITGITISATDAAACSSVVDLWVDTYANFPPTVADTITASAKPTLSTALVNKDTTLTSWTTAVSADSFIRGNVDSNDCTGTVIVTIFGHL